MGKQLLQELCRDRVDRDDPVPGHIRTRWEQWRNELLLLNDFKVQRCFKPTDFGELKSIQLHHFSDASTAGYGQCSYIRLLNVQEQVHCELVMAKSRVSPLKSITIPRLELTAALVSVKVSTILHKELDFEKIVDIYWTDSKVVLGYINNEARRFHIFVANRVQQIRDESTLATTASKENFATIQERLEYFSEWHRAKRAIAVIIRWQRYIRSVHKLNENTSKETRQQYRQCNVEELRRAELAIVKAVQEQTFPQEIQLLRKCDDGDNDRDRNRKRKITLKNTSSLFRLDPFVDDEGILRVGGRLTRASVSFDLKHPVILPRKGHVTALIIRHYHLQNKHQGRGMTLNELRSNGYWITGGSSAVARYIADCVTCRKLRASAQEQKMSDLPKDRLEPSPPFTFCGVDYFGSWLIKEGRREMKRYGVVFTCLASRAIHLEVAKTLKTDSFINALRRFLARRGPVRVMRCDQGTNLLGARNELSEAVKEMNQNKVREFLISKECDWIEFQTNVPSASHMGGIWERQIRTVRNVLNALLDDHGTQLDEESLGTFMCETESIVNSRPLTTDNLTSPDGMEPLTPNHLLTMKSRVLLPPPGEFQREDIYLVKRWRRVQYLVNQFWLRWRKEFLLSLQRRQKWVNPQRNMQVGNIVLIKEDNVSRNRWRTARVDEVYASEDGFVRKVKVIVSDRSLTKEGKRVRTTTVLERPIQKLVLLLKSEDTNTKG